MLTFQHKCTKINSEWRVIIMSNLTSAINVNVPSDVKKEATSLFNSLGISMSTAINIFLKK